MNNQKVQPGVGLGDLKLGVSQEDVMAHLGEPSNRGDLDFGDGTSVRVWEYEAQALSITFAESDDYRLGSITTGHEEVTLAGHQVIGKSEEEFLGLDFGRLGAAELEDDAGDEGKDYGWDEVNLSCWIADGHVISVSIMPLYDESGEIPVWPD